MKLLVSLGGDFLGQWLPACLAAAMPSGAVRMVGELWVDGIKARLAGVSYRCPSFLHPGITADQALRAVIAQEIESFAPNTLVYLTAESVIGRAMIESAEQAGIPAVGLQTFFKRNSVLVHRAGQNWWKVLRDMPLPTVYRVSCENTVGERSANGQLVNIPRARPSQIWAGRLERVFRATLRANYRQTIEIASKQLEVNRASCRNLCNPLWNEVPEVFSTPPVVVALHRPILPPGEPDWLDLIRFAIHAIPPEIPLVLRPHPDESPRLLPPDLAAQLHQRGVYVSLAGRGLSLQDLLTKAQLMITLNSAVGFEALMQSVPTVTITQTYYNRQGLAVYMQPHHHEQLRNLILTNRLPKPQSSLVAAFKQGVIERYAGELPEFKAGVVPAYNLVNHIVDQIKF